MLADGADALPATGIVPPGIPGRSEGDFLPAFDPAAAKRLLAEAGYPDPAAFPVVTLVDTGTGYDAGIIDQLKVNLGVTVRYETLDGPAQGYYGVFKGFRVGSAELLHNQLGLAE